MNSSVVLSRTNDGTGCICGTTNSDGSHVQFPKNVMPRPDCHTFRPPGVLETQGIEIGGAGRLNQTSCQKDHVRHRPGPHAHNRVNAPDQLR